MGWRFRKSINLGGGFKINLSKSGIGYSWGIKGYRITKTASGQIRNNNSIPDTGISYSENISKRNEIKKQLGREVSDEELLKELQKIFLKNLMYFDSTY